MKTGNTRSLVQGLTGVLEPQWSPVMKTGNTPAGARVRAPGPHASMEPGHEDREYVLTWIFCPARCSSLNGARS